MEFNLFGRLININHSGLQAHLRSCKANASITIYDKGDVSVDFCSGITGEVLGSYYHMPLNNIKVNEDTIDIITEVFVFTIKRHFE